LKIKKYKVMQPMNLSLNVKNFNPCLGTLFR
jgi:hypothetical protein